LGFDVAKARADSRVLDPDAASLDRRIPDVTARMAGMNAARARLIGPGGDQGGRSIADMLASTRPTTRLDSPFLRTSLGFPAPGTLLGAVRPDEAYARDISAAVADSVLKTTPKLSSLTVAQSQASFALNGYTARSMADGLGNLRSLEKSTRRWKSIYDDALVGTVTKQVAALERPLVGQYAGSFIQIKKCLNIQSANIGTQVVQYFLRAHEPLLRAALDAFNQPVFDAIRKFAAGHAGLAQLVGESIETWRLRFEGTFEWLRREMERWPRDPYGELVPAWNAWLYRLAQAAYEGDYVAGARFLNGIEADCSPDNVLWIRELLKPTFHPERLDRRVDWEQMDPTTARRWLRRRLNGLKLGAWKEKQERKNGELRYEVERQVIKANPSDLPEFELMEFELREDEITLYEQLRDVLPEQQFLVCWHRAQGLKYKEIAAKMGVALGTVKTHARLLKRNPGFLDILDR
jgi:hypothetical protein